MSKILIIAIALVLAGCGNTADQLAGIGLIKESTSTFDNARVIEVSGAWVAEKHAKDLASTRIGAKWVSSSPEYMIITLNYDSTTGGVGYVSYDGIKVNIDGDVKEFKTIGSTNFSNSGYNSVSQTIYTESKGAIAIPMDYMRKMLEADDVRIRVLFSDAYEDMIFSIEESGWGQTLAKGKIKEILARI